jgi:hypothetical protein
LYSRPSNPCPKGSKASFFERGSIEGHSVAVILLNLYSKNVTSNLGLIDEYTGGGFGEFFTFNPRKY